MRGLMVLAGALTLALLVALWLSGGLELIEAQARAAQRDFQNTLAGVLRRLKSGETGAILALVAVAFGYGVTHAAGPGHGKVLIGGYALASRTSIAKLVGLSLAASLAQATVAILIVYGGVLLVGWSREQLRGVAEAWFAPASALLIGLIGLWLAARGLRHLIRAASRQGHAHAHDHDHAHGHDAAACGHAHGPSAAQVASAGDWRTAAALIAGIAIRPCTGALFLLVLTWQMGIAGAGIAGTYAMGLGTALVTIAAALGAALLREGLIAGLARSRPLALALPILEIVAGLLIVLIATTLAFAPL